MFKIGDRVKCIQGFSDGSHPRTGEIYIVSKPCSATDLIFIKDPDKEKSISCYTRRFELVESQETELITKESLYTLKLSGYKKTITEEKARQLRDELNSLLGE